MVYVLDLMMASEFLMFITLYLLLYKLNNIFKHEIQKIKFVSFSKKWYGKKICCQVNLIYCACFFSSLSLSLITIKKGSASSVV